MKNAIRHYPSLASIIFSGFAKMCVICYWKKTLLRFINSGGYFLWFNYIYNLSTVTIRSDRYVIREQLAEQHNTPFCRFVSEKNNERIGIRSRDPLATDQLLYLLSYPGPLLLLFLCLLKWFL